MDSNPLIKDFKFIKKMLETEDDGVLNKEEYELLHSTLKALFNKILILLVQNYGETDNIQTLITKINKDIYAAKDRKSIEVLLNYFDLLISHDYSKFNELLNRSVDINEIADKCAAVLYAPSNGKLFFGKKLITLNSSNNTHYLVNYEIINRLLNILLDSELIKEIKEYENNRKSQTNNKKRQQRYLDTYNYLKELLENEQSLTCYNKYISRYITVLAGLDNNLEEKFLLDITLTRLKKHKFSMINKFRINHLNKKRIKLEAEANELEEIVKSLKIELVFTIYYIGNKHLISIFMDNFKGVSEYYQSAELLENPFEHIEEVNRDYLARYLQSFNAKNLNEAVLTVSSILASLSDKEKNISTSLSHLSFKAKQLLEDEETYRNILRFTKDDKNSVLYLYILKIINDINHMTIEDIHRFIREFSEEEARVKGEKNYGQEENAKPYTMA